MFLKKLKKRCSDLILKFLKKQCFRDNMWVILVWSFVNVQNKIYNTFLKTTTSEVINSDRSLSNITFILEAKEPLTHDSLSARQQAVDQCITWQQTNVNCHSGSGSSKTALFSVKKHPSGRLQLGCFDKRSSTGRCVLLFQALEQFDGTIWQIIWPAVLWFQGLILHIT